MEVIGSCGLQVHEATIAVGAYPSPLNYGNFPKSVCTSVNEASSSDTTRHSQGACNGCCLELHSLHWDLFRFDTFGAVQVICHGIPDQRPLQNGDIVNVDVSAYYKGFHGDLNETFVVGEVDDDSKRLIRTTLEASKCLFCLVIVGKASSPCGPAHASWCRLRCRICKTFWTVLCKALRRLCALCAPLLPHTCNVSRLKQTHVLLQALQKAIDAVKPGVRYREMGDIISQHVGLQGYQVVRSYCGHGICDLFHCAPNLPHYAHNKVSTPSWGFRVAVRQCNTIICPTASNSPSTGSHEPCPFEIYSRTTQLH